VVYKDDQEWKLFGEEAVVAYFEIHQKESRKAIKMYGIFGVGWVS
jgi:hypothetical protein